MNIQPMSKGRWVRTDCIATPLQRYEHILEAFSWFRWFFVTWNSLAEGVSLVKRLFPSAKE
jgi:hypothetical protein